MRINIDAYTLSKALAIAGKGASTRTLLPVIEGVLFELKENGEIVLSGTDGEIFVRKTIESISGREPIAMVLPKALVQSIATMSIKDRQEVIFNISAPNRLAINTGGIKMTVATANHEDFPAFPGKKEPMWEGVVSHEELKDAITKTAFVAIQATGALANVNLKISDSTIFAEATDGNRLVIKSIKTSGAETEEFNVLVPGKQIHDAMKLFAGDDEDIRILVYENTIIFNSKTLRIAVRTNSAAFPSTSKVLAVMKTDVAKVTLPWDTFTDAVTRAANFANGSPVGVRLADVSSDDLREVSIFAKSEIGLFQESLFLESPADINFPEIHFSPKLALPVFKMARGTELTLATKPRSGILVTNPNDSSWEAVIVPIVMR